MGSDPIVKAKAGTRYMARKLRVQPSGVCFHVVSYMRLLKICLTSD
jgi:hypothetical protein